MMSRGIGWPVSSRRWPLSIGCEISSFTSNASPRFTRFGTLTSTRTMASSVVDAGSERDQQIDAVTPATAVRQLRHGDDRLRGGKANTCGKPRRSGARTELHAQHMRQRIAFREDIDTAQLADR